MNERGVAAMVAGTLEFDGWKVLDERTMGASLRVEVKGKKYEIRVTPVAEDN